MSQSPDLLASDADRTRVSGELREHYEAGRLTLEEFQHRLDELHAARTESQLREVLRQLPSAKLPTVKLRDTRWQSLALQYALVNVITICVWLFSGANGGFWPKWVLLGTLFMFTRRTLGHRHRRRLPPGGPLLAILFVLALAPAARGANYLRLGFDDDTLKWMARPNGFVGVQRELGAPFTRITIPWRRGEVQLRPVVRTYLARAAKAGALRQKIVLAVYADASQAPVDAAARNQYCRYVRTLVAHLPYMSAVVIWNEANSPRYWPEDAGAAAYEALLARCYDVLHAYRPTVNVVDSTASHYDPAAFIASLGQTYRDSGRERPIVDTFGHNPYPEYAAEDPWATHPDTGTIGEGDYETLMTALSQAFAFTAQPVPSATWARLWYLEDGFQTSIPWPYSRLYTGRENDSTVLPAVGAKSQASQLAAAISLAYCQPAVSAFFNFELIDERRLVGWQSGLMYTDGVRKPSFSAYQQVAAAVNTRSIDCSKVVGAPPPPAPSP